MRRGRWLRSVVCGVCQQASIRGAPACSLAALGLPWSAANGGPVKGDRRDVRDGAP
jgi:hypothetical protein